MTSRMLRRSLDDYYREVVDSARRIVNIRGHEEMF